MKPIFAIALMTCLSSCGVVYISPSVSEGEVAGATVRVLEMNTETTLAANRSSFSPKEIPNAFYQVAGVRQTSPQMRAPDSIFDSETAPAALEMRLPPKPNVGAYRIGISDVLLLSTNKSNPAVKETQGMSAAISGPQTYSVQDDGAISIPDVGRVPVVGLTIEDAESEIFRALVENQVDPSFSLEIKEFNSKKVSIGGAVARPGVIPVGLAPMFLDQALSQVGGVTIPEQEFASVRIYRDSTLYQIPLSELYSKRSLRNIRLIDGDSVFVDTEYDLDAAQAYFREQMELLRFKGSERTRVLNELRSEISIRQSDLSERRRNFEQQLTMDAVERDYVYLTGEVRLQTRFVMPFGRRPKLADALYSSPGIDTRTANLAQVYVLRGAADPLEFNSITAYHLNASNASAMILATRFELRPNDVIFVAEQPITRWQRTLSQITPQLVNFTVRNLNN